MNSSKFLKSVLMVLLAFSIALGCLPMSAGAVSVSDFDDVPSGAWYYNAVSYAVSEGLFLGVSSSEFAPEDYMTRGMFITVLGRYAGVNAANWCSATVTDSLVRLRSGPGTTYDKLTTLNKGTSVTLLGVSGEWYKVRYGSYTGYMHGDYLSPDHHYFVDVGYDDYFAGYTIWGYENGIVKGSGTSEYYAPYDLITREEICCLLNRYAEFEGLSMESGSRVDFTDKNTISSWALSDVQAMQGYGIVQGERDNNGYCFRPQSYATRAEVATMFMRLSEKAVDETPDTDPTPTPTPTPAPDDRALFLATKISVPNPTVRVRIFKGTTASSITLANTNGSSFEYGYFNSSREFVSSGTISSASITVTTNGSTYTVKNSAGTVVHTSTSKIAIHPVSTGKALTRVNGGNRYYGDFEFSYVKSNGAFNLINFVNVDDYSKGVLPYEYGSSWPADALKAGAITVRNFVMSYDRGIYGSYGFDLTSTVQVYYGRGKNYSESYFSATDKAVDATKNIYLTYSSNGSKRLCETYYFSSDGGATEDSEHVFGGYRSYLIGKIDPYEASASSQASNYTYSITNSRTGSVMTALASSLGLSTIAKDGIEVQPYPDTGNVYRVVITDVNGKTAVIGQNTSFDRMDFLTKFGFTAYSYRYMVSYNAAADTFTCTRYGWGHNVGLSQWGAYAMAKYYGKDYQDILGFYYEGTYLQYGVY